MRPLPLSHRYHPVVKAARLAAAAGTIAGLAVLGACSDATKTVSSPIQSPRNSSASSGGLGNAGTVKLCASGPAGSYQFTNSGINASAHPTGIAINGLSDGADGGNGVSTANAAGGVAYTVASGACITVLTRTTPDNGFLGSVQCPSLGSPGCTGFPDTWSGITVTATGTPAGVVYDHTDCLLDLGVKDPDPIACSTANNPTRAFMNTDHGTQITFVFVTAPVTDLIPLFVIGDLVDYTVVPEFAPIKGAKPKNNNTVNFWGSQWWKNNPMSQFHSNGWPSFKGYASSVNLTDRTADHPCGTWVSRVGNSPPPPQTIPTLVGIIVTNNVIKIGPDEGGGIQKIIVVHQDGGYGPNPGHDGNGPVVSIQCSGLPQ